MTAQISDNFSIDGVSAQLMCCPALPWHHPRFIQLETGEAHTTSKSMLIFSTACWRQYIADWRLEGGRLYLDAIDGICRLRGDEPLFADWITETLRVSKGERLQYVHMGFGSVYEKDLFIEVRMGVVVGQTERDNRGKMHDAARLSCENLPSPATVMPGLTPGRPRS